MTKILLIEDDPAILLGLEELFQSENYNVLSTSDGKQGYNLALSKIPDILVLDLNLPSLSGLDICRQLRENNFKNPIIMLTARSEQIDKIIGLEIGADDYLTKPFDSRELLSRVRAQLRRMPKINNSNKAARSGDEYKRRLLSIMFTDIKDYSKKMNVNENRAIGLLKTHNQIMNETIINYNGRIVETAGDGYLASFESALEATTCAREIMLKFNKYNNNQTEEEKIELRIGIHIGDVIEFENKLKGDTLNIAARIQQNASPGTVHISKTVYDAIKNKVDFIIEKKGKQTFKNIKNTISIYEIKN